MAAFEIPSLRFSGIANVALERRRFVAPTTDPNYVYATAGSFAVGVSMNDPAINEVLEIADGIVMVEAGAVIAIGVQVEVGTNGKAITKASGLAVGVSLTAAGADTELLSVKMY